jgi:hypothetical protein
MARNLLQNVTVPILVSTDSAKKADGWATFLSNEKLEKVGGFIRVVRREDAREWQRKLTKEEHSILAGTNLLRKAFGDEDEDRDDYTLDVAYKKLRPYITDLAPIDEINIQLPGLTLRSVEQKWNASRWNLSNVVSRKLRAARFVLWFSEGSARPQTAIYCPDQTTAVFAMEFVGAITVCPLCGDVCDGKSRYCSKDVCGQTFRTRRSRWHKKQSLNGPSDTRKAKAKK